ncbi:unnamed protein product [Miscanthus lutarioriparius]|uniref:DUF6598 domain-containing protein n=1 Tax=Miscanthus lutarioriparius TaxID=422564 RepID=A0A811RUB3_9POAL|nr:unnamed protein product [Miscanthus lutarioriparius]
MAVEAAAAWYEEWREVEYLQESIHKKMGSISRRLMMAKDLSEAEVAKLKEERAALRKQVVQLGLEVSPKPDFSCMTEAERAAAAERLRNDEVSYALRLTQEGDPRGRSMEASARIVDFDPKQGGRYYSRYSRGNLINLDLDEESPIGPMRCIDYPYKSESDYPWLCTAVNFLSVKIGCSDVGYPICVYGTIIVRDSVDVRCVYHFRRDSDNCQLINSEAESLILTGPKRGLALCEDIYVETDLKVKDDLVQDRELSKGLISIRSASTGPSVTGYTLQTKSLATRLSTVDVTYTVVDRALEGTIAVEVLQGGFHGKITAYTANMQYKLVLYDSKEADAMTVDDCGVLELMRPVVSVYVKDLLMIAAQTSDGKSERIVFTPRINARDERPLAVGATKLRVKLSWSVMDP